MDFWPFWAARHISRANCTKIDWDRHGEAAYEVFSIERRFQRPSLDFLGSRKPAQEGIKKRYLPKSRLIFNRCWPVFRENSCR